MASKTEIINMALMHAGCKTIISLTENSEESKAANLFYDTVRDGVLAELPWTFCTAEQRMNALSSSPGHSYSYSMPPDCLKLLSVFRSGDDKAPLDAGRYVIVSGSVMTICTDVPGDYIARYIQKLNVEELFSADFVECFSFRLASKFALAIGKDSGGAFGLMQIYTALINAAAGAHIQQNNPQPTRGSGYVNARNGVGVGSEAGRQR